jgi:hypothetical protein
MIDFFTRWSRTKRGLDGEEASADAVTAAPDFAPPETEPAEARAPAAPPLPGLDELTADADFTAFMRPEVPPVLRNAALRRLWLLDPEIRDFVGPARDYAYDWNTPGGVPGGGPLSPMTDVKAMATSLLRPRQASGDHVREAPSRNEPLEVACAGGGETASEVIEDDVRS